MIIRQVLGRFTKRRAWQGKQKLRATVPNFLTLGNACFGFFSIMQASTGNVIASAYCILVAAIFDFMDGRIARYFSCVSYFGAELDSLCDVVSFCVAPAVLLYSYCLQESGICAVIVLTIYLCAGLFRLARFNTSANQASSFFSGLPTPMAASFLASIVMYHAWLAKRGFFVIEPKGLMVFTVLIALLMISTIPFPSCKIARRYSSCLIIVGMLCTGFGLLCNNYPVFFFMSSCYIIFALSAFLVDAIRWKVSKF
jgi:CDP-diacylglycerol---serine O-phosphatidyltransferase